MSYDRNMERDSSSTSLNIWLSTTIRFHFCLFHGDVQLDDLFSQRIAIESQKLSCLYLIASCLSESRSNEGPFHGGDQDRMKVSPRSVPHPFDEFRHLHLQITLQRTITGFALMETAGRVHQLDHF